MSRRRRMVAHTYLVRDQDAETELARDALAIVLRQEAEEHGLAVPAEAVPDFTDGSIDRQAPAGWRAIRVALTWGLAAVLVAGAGVSSSAAPTARIRDGGKARLSYYRGALGACGPLEGNYVAHRSLACGTRIKLARRGRTAIVYVADRCPTCGPNGLDAAPHVFSKLGIPLSQGIGRANVVWIRR